MSEKYTEIKTIKRDEIYHYVTTADKKEWCILRIEPWWDTDKMLADMREELTGLTMRAKDREIYKEFYEGISIQYTNLDKTEEAKNYGSLERNSLPGEPVYRNDGVLYFTRKGFSSTPPPDVNLVEMDADLQRIFDVLASKPSITCPQYLNDWGKAWPNIMLDFAKHGMMFVRGRYLKTHPTQYANMHSDGECRLHFPVWSNEECFFTFFEDTPYEYGKYKELGKFNLPADGSAYLFNAHVNHNFGNFGNADRTHAVFGLQTYQHVAWKHHQQNLPRFGDILADYAKHLMKIKEKYRVEGK